MSCDPKSQRDKSRRSALEVLRVLDRIRRQTVAFGDYEGDPVNQARDEREAEVEDVWRDWLKRFLDDKPHGHWNG